MTVRFSQLRADVARFDRIDIGTTLADSYNDLTEQSWTRDASQLTNNVFNKENFEMIENRQSEGFNTPTSNTPTSSPGAGTAAARSQTAQDYGQRISEAATQAKDYVSDKVSVVGGKLKELQNADFGEITANAKDYARKNPGQAILISAAAGLVLGLILRGRR